MRFFSPAFFKGLFVGKKLDVWYLKTVFGEIQDADGSGTLQMAELLHGLLKIRGDLASRSSVLTDGA